MCRQMQFFRKSVFFSYTPHKLPCSPATGRIWESKLSGRKVKTIILHWEVRDSQLDLTKLRNSRLNIGLIIDKQKISRFFFLLSSPGFLARPSEEEIWPSAIGKVITAILLCQLHWEHPDKTVVYML